MNTPVRFRKPSTSLLVTTASTASVSSLGLWNRRARSGPTRGKARRDKAYLKEDLLALWPEVDCLGQVDHGHGSRGACRKVGPSSWIGPLVDVAWEGGGGGHTSL